MITLKIPYSKSYIETSIDERFLKGILESDLHKQSPDCSQEEIVEKALENPINSPKLEEMAGKANKILIITSDHTRPVPSAITLPILLKHIRKGNPQAEIKILIATGCHRASTYEEMVQKYGKDLVETEDFINHDSRDDDNMVFKGILPSGGELWLNSLIDWCDLLISEGFIEPHFFAGFSGGRKSILPGIASEKTVWANHCSKFISDPKARAGIIDNNPIHKDMIYAAETAGLAFILNVVINDKKEIIAAFAGHPEDAHKKGCQFVTNHAKIPPLDADIVITSNGGYPLDQNIYQAVKGMTAAEAHVKPGGVIIMVSACEDGHGGESFYKWLAESSGPHEVYEKIMNISQAETIPDQWEAQVLARVLMKATVIMVTDKCDPKLITDMHMLHAYTLEQALQKARQIAGENASILVIPDGVSVIP
ncbi:MAG TPA: nickel-dependent lactate racemase [Clostridiaceae bacterium]|nr:nickel-dependent lactate racemase [Clostridiaceae bacterium]